MPKPNPDKETKHEQTRNTRQLYFRRHERWPPSDDVVVRRRDPEIAASSSTRRDRCTHWTEISYRESGPKGGYSPEAQPLENKPLARPTTARLEQNSTPTNENDPIAYLIERVMKRRSTQITARTKPDTPETALEKNRKNNKLSWDTRSATTTRHRDLRALPPDLTRDGESPHAPTGDHPKKRRNRSQIRGDWNPNWTMPTNPPPRH